ncbi:hypothetical protein MKZ38_006064 [Zalerion maritima]|uniref:DUF7791 domain-containing protein n=1 Tax=Zalerion maritima TaxID=339359 RepID=A0AAD5RJB5_9PEZI|nr:hypothetical protein MKZ38_006064 [Zalerion maritima]
MKMEAMSEDEIRLRIEAVTGRLNSRCKGFLKVKEGSLGLDDINYIPHDAPQPTVQYLHRTVRDYIKSSRAQEFLHSSTSPNFDPSMQLCLAYIMGVKTWGDPQSGMDSIDHHMKATMIVACAEKCLRQASEVGKENEGAVVGLLDELKTICARWNCLPWLEQDDATQPQPNGVH